MTTMNISLPDTLKSFVDEQVNQRGYGTSSEYVRELIRKDQDRLQLRGLLLAGAASNPAAPADAVGPAIEHSYAGQIGHVLQVLFAPLGFNWQISVALLTGMAAREVAIGALATVYAVVAAGGGAATATALAPVLAGQWSLATGMALLAWYIFAPQCLSTLVAIHRESGGWKLPVITLGYQLALAYAAAFITFRVVSHWV